MYIIIISSHFSTFCFMELIHLWNERLNSVSITYSTAIDKITKIIDHQAVIRESVSSLHWHQIEIIFSDIDPIYRLYLI